jgi:cobalt-zinc-cadmium efflux system outer membrane protein
MRHVKTLLQQLEVPAAITFGAPKVVMPNPKDFKTKEEWQAAVEKAVPRYFPQLSPVGAEPTELAIAGPKGEPLTLSDLQQLARANSPLLRQAGDDVEWARGAMIQAGLYSNPTLSVTTNSALTSGGPLILAPLSLSQNISTMGKLKLAQAAAAMDFENARLAYRRAETDLAASVRTNYFAVLVAEESTRETRALVELTDALYQVMVKQLKQGEFAAYEPMQVGVFAGQARQALITARNQYLLAWKNLATTLGLPAMPPTQLAGDIRQMPLPQWRYDAALAHVLQQHTDVLSAENGILKARLLLRLAQVTNVPDITLSAGLNVDQTPGGTRQMGATVSVGGPIPVFNFNQGNIRSAQAALMRAVEEPHRVRDALTASVADAYRRYYESGQLLELYRKNILPQQVEAYRAAVKRHYGGEAGGVAYTDLIAAEQSLVTVISSYLGTTLAQWQAVSDLGSLLQTDDLFQLAEGAHLAEMPDLQHLVDLDCCHPCNPLPNPALRQADLQWPSTTIPPSLPAGQPAPQGTGTNSPAYLPALTAPAAKIGG